MNRKHALILLGMATVAFTVAGALPTPVRGAAHPSILAFEFCRSEARAAQIMAEWGPKGRNAARISLWLDYGYMLSYGGFFTLAGLATCDLARTRNWRRLAVAGAIVPFFAAAAAMFDAVENMFLLLVLGGHGGELGPLIATTCSSIKFTLITIAILYVLCGLAQRLRWRLQPS
jgi:hypothetical protein